MAKRSQRPNDPHSLSMSYPFNHGREVYDASFICSTWFFTFRIFARFRLIIYPIYRERERKQREKRERKERERERGREIDRDRAREIERDRER